MGTKAVRGVPTNAYFGGGANKKWKCTDDMTTVTIPRSIAASVKEVALLFDSGQITIEQIKSFLADR